MRNCVLWDSKSATKHWLRSQCYFLLCLSQSYISPPEVGTHCVCEITARHRRRARALFYFTSSTFFQVCKYLLLWCLSYNGLILNLWVVLLLITSKISLFHPTCSPRREAKSRLDKKREMRFFFIFLLQERVMESLLLVFKLLSILQSIWILWIVLE